MNAPLVYVLLGEMKIHAYGSYLTARRIYVRARRMGVKVEWLQREIKRGERYPKHTSLDKTLDRCGCAEVAP